MPNIFNMVESRCIIVVKSELKKNGLNSFALGIGEVEIIQFRKTFNPLF